MERQTADGVDVGVTSVNATSHSDWLTIAEVATVLRIPSSTAYELARTGRIPNVKIGRHRRVSREWLEGLAAKGPAPQLPNSVSSRPAWEGTHA